MKERDVIRRAIGEEILDKEQIRRRAIETAKARAASETHDTIGERTRIRRRWVWAANLVLVAVLAAVVLLVAHPLWRPAGEGATTPSVPGSTPAVTGETSLPSGITVPTGPRTADPAVLATLPDTVTYNEKRDEYYDAAFVTWDGAAGRYRIVWNGTPPISFYQSGIDPDVWRVCFSDPDHPLDRLLPEVFTAYHQMLDGDPVFTNLVSKSSSGWLFAEVLEGPLSPLADLRLSLLPRMFGYMDLGSGAYVEYSSGMHDMFRFITARIETPRFSYQTRSEGTDRWGQDLWPFQAAWGADSAHVISALLAVFRDRVNQAPGALAALTDPGVSSGDKEALMATYGVAALPFYFQSVLLYGEEAYLPYVHAALPMWLVRREAAAGRTVDASTDGETIRGYLAECWEDAQGVFAVGQYRFRWEENAEPSDLPYYISRYDGKVRENRFAAAVGNGSEWEWSVSLWDRHAPEGPDEGRYAALISLAAHADLTEADREQLTGTVPFTIATPSFTAAFVCDLDAREIRTPEVVTGYTFPAPEVSAVLDHEPSGDTGPAVLKIIVGFSGPPMEEGEIICTVDGIAGEMEKFQRRG